jgi:hypothetical protein
MASSFDSESPSKLIYSDQDYMNMVPKAASATGMRFLSTHLDSKIKRERERVKSSRDVSKVLLE